MNFPVLLASYYNPDILDFYGTRRAAFAPASPAPAGSPADGLLSRKMFFREILWSAVLLFSVHRFIFIVLALFQKDC